MSAPEKKLKLRHVPITPEMFARLPALLDRAQVEMITGLDRNAIDDLRSSGTLGAVAPRGKYHKYHKLDVGRLIGFVKEPKTEGTK